MPTTTRRLRLAALVGAGLLVTAWTLTIELLPASAATGPTAAIARTSTWSSGYGASVTITNGGTSTLTSWKVEFDLPAGTTVSNSWNATMTISGQHYTFVNASFNGTIKPGASKSFGFNAAGTGDATGCLLNGAACGGNTPPATPPVTVSDIVVTPTSHTPPASSPPSTGGKTWNVTNSAELKNALAAVNPGDTIKLADGSYADQFVATRPGVASKPITLTGGKNAILTDPLFTPATTDCPSGQTGYGLWLNGASYWNLIGFTVGGGKKGIVVDASPHVTIDGVTVTNIGYEGVHFRKGSDHGVIKNSTVTNTGREEPGYGEGVYIGSANSNFECYATSGGVDASDYVQVLNNKIGPGVAAEAVDIKEGTHDGLISGNVFDGTGSAGQHDADSNIDVKGDNYQIIGNTGTHPLLDAFQVHNVWGNTGCGNVFKANKLSVTAAAGYGIHVTDISQCTSKPNVVYASNTSTGGKGLTNATVTQGG